MDARKKSLARQYYDNAVNHAEAKDLHNTEAWLRLMLTLTPTNSDVQAYINAGNYYYKRLHRSPVTLEQPANVCTAIAFYEMADLPDVKDFDMLMRLSHCYLHYNCFELAYKTLRRAMQLEPHNPQPYHELGIAFITQALLNAHNYSTREYFVQFLKYAKHAIGKAKLINPNDEVIAENFCLVKILKEGPCYGQLHNRLPLWHGGSKKLYPLLMDCLNTYAASRTRSIIGGQTHYKPENYKMMGMLQLIHSQQPTQVKINNHDMRKKL